MKPITTIILLLCCFAATHSLAQNAPRDTVPSNKTRDTSGTPPIQLKTVHIVQYHFFKDSLSFREEYGRELTFRRPKWYEVYTGMALNINNLYKATQFKKNNKKIAMKHLLLNKEQEMFVSRVYTPSLVNKVTKLDGDSLQLFMQHYTPSYSFIKGSSDYDLYLEIKKQYEAFLKTRDSLPPQP